MNKEYYEENLKVLKNFIKLDIVYKDILKNIIKCFEDNHKLIFMGNGGSAADSNHIVSEFVAHFKLDRKGLPAISLTANNSLITAIGNDYSFDNIYEKQIDAIGEKGDIVFGISTSGKSINIIKALNKAQSKGIKSVLVTGENTVKGIDCVVNIPSLDTSIIQNMYMIFFHMLCLDIDRYYYEYRN